ncbi:MAG: OsmC family protein [Polaribacter sp.]|jgi:putative redox protein|nr:OsmC family protein [Polaribacter sp.]MDG1953958.1 OsmC family protein [Polaribacter sp.]
MATNTVTTSWKKNGIFESDNPSKHSLIMYDASDDNGDLVGFGPKALMLSSLAGCSGLDVDSLLKKMRAEVADFNIIVTGELTEEHPKFYHKVHVDYHFYGTDLKEDKITKAVNLSVDRYCGVMEMFRQFAEISTEIHLHENE